MDDETNQQDQTMLNISEIELEWGSKDPNTLTGPNCAGGARRDPVGARGTVGIGEEEAQEEQEQVGWQGHRCPW